MQKCRNAEGTEKLKPLVIGKSAKPRCFSGVNMKNLPVEYKSNKKSWMTNQIFREWLLNLNTKFERKKRRIILFMDNFSGHNSDNLILENIGKYFLTEFEVFFFSMYPCRPAFFPFASSKNCR